MLGTTYMRFQGSGTLYAGKRQRGKTSVISDLFTPRAIPSNCLCTWFRFDQDAAGARFGAQSLQEQGQEGDVAISAPVEAKDQLVETGLEALGAQPLRLENTVWIQARISRAGLSPTTWGRWRSRGNALQPSVLTVAAVLAHSEVAEILGVAGRDRGQPQAARHVAVAEFDRAGDRHLAFRCCAAAGWPRRSRLDRTAGCAWG